MTRNLLTLARRLALAIGFLGLGAAHAADGFLPAREAYQYEADEVRTSDNLPLSPPDKKRFFQENAERVFGLGSEPFSRSGKGL